MSVLPIRQLYHLESREQTDIPRLLDPCTEAQEEVSEQYALSHLPDDTSRIHLRENQESTDDTGHETQPDTFPTRAAKALSRDTFISLQEWEGIVEEVREDSFDARLVDLTQESPDEILEDFPLDDISEEDRNLVAPGAVFYWCIGYHVRKGQRSRTSEIRFRRLPAWSEGEIEDARRKAEERRCAIMWE